jgi:hypothetical protein
MVSGRDDENGPADDDLSDDERRAKRLKTGIGIGIGSAAVVAALLYANRSRNKKSDKNNPPRAVREDD